MIDESRPETRLELQDSPQLRGPANFDPVVSTGVRRPLRRLHGVDPVTGFAVSSLPAGRWHHGAIHRQPTPALALPINWPVMDPTAKPRDEHPSTYVRPEGIPGAQV